MVVALGRRSIEVESLYRFLNMLRKRLLGVLNMCGVG